MYENGYIPPILTVDIIIFAIVEGQLSVLLVKRRNEPFKDVYAIPGGYNAAGETTMEATTRVAEAKAGVSVCDLKLVQQLHTFDTVARDPRGHAVSVTYIGLIEGVAPTLSPTTQDPQFFAICDLPELAYDHKDIIAFAHQRLKSDIMQTTAIFALLPTQFSLSQLQAAYEAILGQSLDKRNFRKKVQSLDILAPTDEYYKEGAHRPARYYRFKTQDLRPLNQNF